MLHMIDDQLTAYRIAVETRAKAEVNWYNDDADATELRACREEEQLRLNGLQSVIGMAIREYAAREPCNPFSINGDVNQPPVALQDAVAAAIQEGQDWFDDSNADISSADCIDNMMTILDEATSAPPSNEHGTFPPPPKRSS